MIGSRMFFSSFWFWEEGRPSHEFSYFPYLFYHRFLVSNCSKFCVKQMRSSVSSTSGYSLKKHSYPVPFTKNLPLSIAFCPEQSFFGTHSPLMFNHLSHSLGMFKSKIKTHLSLYICSTLFPMSPPSSFPLPLPYFQPLFNPLLTGAQLR